ncbi:MAG: hypothetical protein NPIRA05_14170 [Nitrospirales bacterium]|nr:MAG: hypothetical protein NPIRA05_14170 [Nitrospirales bacterium]
MTGPYRLGVFCILTGTLTFGCSMSSQTIHSDQESLGHGIVVGSLAEQRKQQHIMEAWPSSRTIIGQVKKIEGAAYLLTNNTGETIRLPVDQETMIDRPAHVGDWLKAYTDPSGRALQIRNIDEEMMVAEN